MVTTPTPTPTPTSDRTDARLRIDLWSDVVCPWCYLGAARLRKAIAASPRADAIDLVFHAFELDPSAPAEAHPNLEYLTAKFGMPVAQVEEMEAGMAARAAAEGLPYTAHRPHAGTFDIHRLTAFAATMGKAEALMTALQHELFSGGRKAQLWEAFTTLYSQLSAEAEDDFHEVFGKAFVEAYQDQLDRLSDQQARGDA